MARQRKRPEELRSHRWFGAKDLRAFGHRSRALQMGFAREDFAGKPVIAIVNTWSDINLCHSHFRQRAEEVKRGIWQAGGFPVEMPAITLSEPFQKPSTMMYRNLLAMETEELLRSYPADGAVIKPTAAEARLLKHTGRAVVFKDYNDMVARIDDGKLDIDENCVIVLQNGGPLGGPGMPEWGQLPIPDPEIH